MNTSMMKKKQSKFTPLKDYEKGKEDGFCNLAAQKDSDSYMFGYREGLFDKQEFLKEFSTI